MDESVRQPPRVLAARGRDRVEIGEEYGPIELGTLARLIDSVAGSIPPLSKSKRPAMLEALLEVLWRSSERQTTQMMLRIAVQAEDPRSELGAVVQDGLRTARALERLCEAKHWRHPGAVVDRPRAIALYQLVSARLVDGETVLAAGMSRRYRAVKARLWQAAEMERSRFGGEIETVAEDRERRIPELFAIYEWFANRK